MRYHESGDSRWYWHYILSYLTVLTSVNDGEIRVTVAVGEHHSWRQRTGERVPIRQRAFTGSHLPGGGRWPRDRWRHRDSRQTVQAAWVLPTSRHRCAPAAPPHKTHCILSYSQCQLDKKASYCKQIARQHSRHKKNWTFAIFPTLRVNTTPQLKKFPLQFCKMALALRKQSYIPIRWWKEFHMCIVLIQHYSETIRWTDWQIYVVHMHNMLTRDKSVDVANHVA